MSQLRDVTTQFVSRSALRPRSARGVIVCKANGTDEPSSSSSSSRQSETVRAGQVGSLKSKREADSTDGISTFLTRRFGIAGGLAWVGVLATGVLGEQIKTRLEQADEAAGTKDITGAAEVVLPDGVRYQDLRVGGGSFPIDKYLVIMNYKGFANGELFEDTAARGKPIVIVFGGRPFTGGMCPGLEEALRTMRAGGIRKVHIPAELGFPDGMVLRPTEHVPGKVGGIPPGAELDYEVELLRVSIPPS